MDDTWWQKQVNWKNAESKKGKAGNQEQVKQLLPIHWPRSILLEL